MAKRLSQLFAPSLTDFEILAAQAYVGLPAAFRDLCGEIVFRIEDFATDDVLDDLRAESPFDILGLFQGLGLAQDQAVPETGRLPNMIFLYLCVLVSRRFDYWEVKGNELLHHHGFLSNLERFSAPNLRIDKEINDVFEYLLLRSGRLIIHASNERRAIVLENVLFINDKEERITKMLGALQVRVRTDRE